MSNRLMPPTEAVVSQFSKIAHNFAESISIIVDGADEGGLMATAEGANDLDQEHPPTAFAYLNMDQLFELCESYSERKNIRDMEKSLNDSLSESASKMSTGPKESTATGSVHVHGELLEKVRTMLRRGLGWHDGALKLPKTSVFPWTSMPEEIKEKTEPILEKLEDELTDLPPPRFAALEIIPSDKAPSMQRRGSQAAALPLNGITAPAVSAAEAIKARLVDHSTHIYSHICHIDDDTESKLLSMRFYSNDEEEIFHLRRHFLLDLLSRATIRAYHAALSPEQMLLLLDVLKRTHDAYIYSTFEDWGVAEPTYAIQIFKRFLFSALSQPEAPRFTTSDLQDTLDDFIRGYAQHARLYAAVFNMPHEVEDLYREACPWDYIPDEAKSGTAAIMPPLSEGMTIKEHAEWVAEQERLAREAEEAKLRPAEEENEGKPKKGGKNKDDKKGGKAAAAAVSDDKKKGDKPKRNITSAGPRDSKPEDEITPTIVAPPTEIKTEVVAETSITPTTPALVVPQVISLPEAPITLDATLEARLRHFYREHADPEHPLHLVNVRMPPPNEPKKDSNVLEQFPNDISRRPSISITEAPPSFDSEALSVYQQLWRDVTDEHIRRFLAYVDERLAVQNQIQFEQWCKHAPPNALKAMAAIDKSHATVPPLTPANANP